MGLPIQGFILAASLAFQAETFEEPPLSSFPAEIREVVGNLQGLCSAAGGRSDFVTGAVQRADINRDGLPDYVFSGGSNICSDPTVRDSADGMVAGSICRRDGTCPHWLFVSQPGGGYRLAWSEPVFSAMVIDEDRGPIAVFTRSACESNACQYTLTWNGRAVVRAGAYRPPRR